MAVTETKTFGDGARTLDSYINRIKYAWTSDGSGNATLVTGVINGTICKVEFVPSASAAPTDNYGVTLTDVGGVDVLAGQGANLDTATATAVIPGVPCTDGTTTSVGPCVVADPLTLSVSGAGSNKQGQVILYVR